MISFRLKPLLLFLPLLLWIVFFIVLQIGQWLSAKNLYDSNSVTWGNGSSLLTASINSLSNNNVELNQYVIIVEDIDGNKVMSEPVSIDWDMGGGGLISFMQIDEDTEMELIVAVKAGNDKTNFYLDYSSGQVQKKPLTMLGEAAGKALDGWLFFHVPNPFSIGLFIMITVIYYIFFFPVSWIVTKKKKSR